MIINNVCKPLDKIKKIKGNIILNAKAISYYQKARQVSIHINSLICNSVEQKL